jgi:hypothetical protein
MGVEGAERPQVSVLGASGLSGKLIDDADIAALCLAGC